MRSDRKYLSLLSFFLGTCFIFGCFVVFYRVNTRELYIEYANLWDYRRMRPEFQQDPRMIRLTDAGHTTTYADIMWINLIQYIADNINNNLFVTYAPPLLDTISELHPHFTRAYTLALLLTPSLDREGISFVPENLEIAAKNLKIGEK